MKSSLREIGITLILAVVIFLGLQAAVSSSVIIGPSMEPSFHNGQRLVVSKVTYSFREPERGDVITFHAPNNSQEDFIKRVIGLPGDTIEIKGGKVYVNGSQLDEHYIADSPNYTFHRQEVPEDSYFVLGDNRNNSNDSHNGWMVPRQNIIGSAWLSIWPLGEWGLVAHYPLEEQLVSSTEN